MRYYIYTLLGICILFAACNNEAGDAMKKTTSLTQADIKGKVKTQTKTEYYGEAFKDFNKWYPRDFENKIVTVSTYNEDGNIIMKQISNYQQGRVLSRTDSSVYTKDTIYTYTCRQGQVLATAREYFTDATHKHLEIIDGASGRKVYEENDIIDNNGRMTLSEDISYDAGGRIAAHVEHKIDYSPDGGVGTITKRDLSTYISSTLKYDVIERDDKKNATVIILTVNNKPLLINYSYSYY